MNSAFSAAWQESSRQTGAINHLKYETDLAQGKKTIQKTTSHFTAECKTEKDTEAEA